MCVCEVVRSEGGGAGASARRPATAAAPATFAHPHAHQLRDRPPLSLGPPRPPAATLHTKQDVVAERLKEQADLERKLTRLAKSMDHLERARREEEAPYVEEAYKRRAEEDSRLQEEMRRVAAEQHRAAWEAWIKAGRPKAGATAAAAALASGAPTAVAVAAAARQVSAAEAQCALAQLAAHDEMADL